MKATVGQIWRAASTDEARPVLTCVAFDAETGVLLASDSFIAARVPCEVEDGDVSGLIPAAALKEANGRSLRIADGEATLTLPDGSRRSWKLLEGTFPDVAKFIGQAEEVEAPFGLNPRLFSALAAALGADNGYPLTVHPTHPLKPVLCAGLMSSAGILMPVRLTGAEAAARGRLDVANDAAVIAGVRAAATALARKRGSKRAAEAFREAMRATIEAQS